MTDEGGINVLRASNQCSPEASSTPPDPYRLPLLWWRHCFRCVAQAGTPRTGSVPAPRKVPLFGTAPIPELPVFSAPILEPPRAKPEGRLPPPRFAQRGPMPSMANVVLWNGQADALARCLDWSGARLGRSGLPRLLRTRLWGFDGRVHE